MPTLHVGFPVPADLSDAAGRIAAALGAVKLGEHDSSNFPDGSYFKADAHDASVTIALEDDIGYDDYDYWVVVEPGAGVEADLTKAARLIAGELLRDGLRVCWGLEDDPDADENHVVRLVFELSPDDAHGVSERRVVVRIPAD
jgi:hypothetical protein